MSSTGSAGLKLARQGGLYTLGLVLLRAGNVLLVPLYTSLLDEAEYGAFGVVRHLVNFLVPLAIVGQTHSLLRLGVDVDDDPKARSELLGTVVAWVLAATVTLAAIAALLWPALDRWIEGVPLWPIGLAGLAMVTGQAMMNIVLTWLQHDGKAAAHTRLNASRMVLLVIGVLVFVGVFRLGATGILIAMAISFTLAAGAGLAIVLPSRRLQVSRVALGASLAYGLPLLPHTLSTIVFSATDQLLLAASDSEGLGSAGLYLLATQVASVVFMFGMGMQKAWLPFFLREDRDRADAGDWGRVRALSFFGLAVVGTVAVGVGLLAPEAVSIASFFSDRDWSAAATVVPILVLGAFMRSYYFVALSVVMANKATARWIAAVTLPTAALNIVLNSLWIPKWGMQGAAWATVTSWVLTTLAAGVLARRARKVPFKYLHAGLLAGLVVVALQIGGGESLPIRLGVIVAFVLAVLAIDGRDIRSAVRSLRRRRSGRVDKDEPDA